MPLYQYQCDKCGYKSEDIRPIEHRNEIVRCRCGGNQMKQQSRCTLITDTSFSYTGEYDSRLCRNRSDKIQGRKDFFRRCDAKNLRPVEKKEVAEVSSDSTDNVKKYLRTGSFT